MDVTCTINGVLYSWDSIVVLDPTPVISSISPNQVATINQPVTLTFSGQGFGLLRPGVSVNPGVSFGTASFPTSPGITPNQGRQFTVPVTFSAGGTYSFYVTSNGVVSPGFAGGFGTAAGSVLNSSVSNVVTVSVCAPAISSIRVDGQNTNSIIAGMSGVISILGTCLSGNPTISGSGITLSTPQYTLNNQQLTMNYVSTAAATTGLQTITLGPSLTRQVFVTKLTLSSVSFNNDLPVKKDVAGAYDPNLQINLYPNAPILKPQWAAMSSNNSTGTSEAVAYVAGQRMNLEAKFKIDPPPPNPIPSITSNGQVGGFGGVSMTGIASSSSSEVVVTFQANDAFEFRTKFFNPMTIDWNICGPNCISVGSSSNRLYVTRAQPISGFDVWLTPLHLAVANDGAFSLSDAFAKTWGRFANNAGAAGVRTWDNRPLYYYNAGFEACVTDAVPLINSATGNGQCGSFMMLLQHALAMNGIPSSRILVQPLISVVDLQEQMVVKWWTFGGLSGPNPDYPYRMYLNNGDFMVPIPTPYGVESFGDLTNENELRGQNTAPPKEKVFSIHFILYVDPGYTATSMGVGTPPDVACGDSTSNPGPFFDPSYGAYYASAAGFQCKAVAGYALYWTPLNSTINQFGVRQPEPYGTTVPSVGLFLWQ